MTALTDRPTATSDRSATTARLLTAGAVAGPLFVVTAGLQVLTRDGFDLSRHYVSQLSLGAHGWLQIASFVVTGALFVLGAVGMRRALGAGRVARWGPRLVGLFGVALVVAGGFVTDPANGFPVGTSGHPGVSWHGAVHAAAPVLGTLALAAACVVFTCRFVRLRERGWVAYSIVAGVALFAPDLLIGRAGHTIVLAAAAAVGWTWVSAVALHLRADARNQRATSAQSPARMLRSDRDSARRA